MLVVLDANALISNFQQRGTAWDVIAYAMRSWGVEVHVTEGVLIETVAGYQRRVAIAKDAMAKSLTFGRVLGVHEHLDQHATALDEAATSYRDRLVQRLTELGVEITTYPDVPHGVLVQRAADRVLPCDANGDGYRDTLWWLGVLELGQRDLSRPLVLVTADTDFVDDEGQLYQALIDEAVASGIENLTVLADLDSLARHLVAQHGDVEPADVTEALRATWLREAKQGFARITGLGFEGQVDGSAGALPRQATMGLVARVDEPTSFTLDTVTTVGDQRVATFTARANSAVVFGVPGEIEPVDNEMVIFASEDATLLRFEKDLEYRGLVSFGSEARLLDLQIADITAPADDPMRLAQAAQHRAAQQLSPEERRIQVAAIRRLHELRPTLSLVELKRLLSPPTSTNRTNVGLAWNDLEGITWDDLRNFTWGELAGDDPQPPRPAEGASDDGGGGPQS